jgi:hypothetical protein
MVRLSGGLRRDLRTQIQAIEQDAIRRTGQ